MVTLLLLLFQIKKNVDFVFFQFVNCMVSFNLPVLKQVHSPEQIYITDHFQVSLAKTPMQIYGHHPDFFLDQDISKHCASFYPMTKLKTNSLTSHLQFWCTKIASLFCTQILHRNLLTNMTPSPIIVSILRYTLYVAFGFAVGFIFIYQYLK